MQYRRLCQSRKPIEVSRRGFTLLELVVVVAVISVLVALLVPAVQSARESSRIAACRNNLRQLSLAMHSFVDVYRYFPPGHLGPPEDADPDDHQPDQWSGHLGFILPYIEQSAMFNQLSTQNWSIKERLGPAWFHNAGEWSLLSKNRIPTFQCPSDPTTETDDVVLSVHKVGVMFGGLASGAGVTSYLGCAGTSGLFGGASLAQQGIFRSREVCRVADVTDGLSNTLLAGEVLGNAAVDQLAVTTARHSVMSGGVYADALQQQPGESFVGPAQAMLFRSRHSGIINVALGDGSVRGLSVSIDVMVLAALGGRGDGDVVSEF